MLKFFRHIFFIQRIKIIFYKKKKHLIIDCFVSKSGQFYSAAKAKINHIKTFVHQVRGLSNNFHLCRINAKALQKSNSSRSRPIVDGETFCKAPKMLCKRFDVVYPIHATCH